MECIDCPSLSYPNSTLGECKRKVPSNFKFNMQHEYFSSLIQISVPPVKWPSYVLGSIVFLSLWLDLYYLLEPLTHKSRKFKIITQNSYLILKITEYSGIQRGRFRHSRFMFALKLLECDHTDEQMYCECILEEFIWA